MTRTTLSEHVSLNRPSSRPTPDRPNPTVVIPVEKDDVHQRERGRLIRPEQEYRVIPSFSRSFRVCMTVKRTEDDWIRSVFWSDIGSARFYLTCRTSFLDFYCNVPVVLSRSSPNPVKR